MEDFNSFYSKLIKTLIVFGLLFLIPFIISSILVIYPLLFSDNFHPMSGSAYVGVQQVEKETVQIGENIVVTDIEKCNTYDEIISVVTVQYWKQYSPTTKTLESGRGVALFAPKECKTKTFVNEMPSFVTPGIWQIIGIGEAVSKHNNKQQIIWQTELFTVLDSTSNTAERSDLTQVQSGKGIE